MNRKRAQRVVQRAAKRADPANQKHVPWAERTRAALEAAGKTSDEIHAKWMRKLFKGDAWPPRWEFSGLDVRIVDNQGEPATPWVSSRRRAKRILSEKAGRDRAERGERRGAC